MKKYEYKVIKTDETGIWEGTYKLDASTTEDNLNKLGFDGWELISVIDTITGGSSKGFTMFFKRESRV
jgi:hypothetical protein